MALIGTRDGTGGGWTLTASGNVQGGTAAGINVDLIQASANSALSSGDGIHVMADEFGAAIGSKVSAKSGTGAVTTDRHGVAKAVSGGTLAFTPTTTGTRSEEFIIRGVTTKIGGVANTQLQSPGTFNDGKIKDNLHSTITAGSGGFANAGNVYDMMATPSTNITPNFTPHSASYQTDKATNKYTFQNTTDTTVAVSGEIFPTQAVPGELTYHFGGVAKPTTDEYKAKNAFEAADDTSS